jgi:hypothetical protein
VVAARAAAREVGKEAVRVAVAMVVEVRAAEGKAVAARGEVALAEVREAEGKGVAARGAVALAVEDKVARMEVAPMVMEIELGAEVLEVTVEVMGVEATAVEPVGEWMVVEMEADTAGAGPVGGLEGAVAVEREEACLAAVHMGALMEVHKAAREEEMVAAEMEVARAVEKAVVMVAEAIVVVVVVAVTVAVLVATVATVEQESSEAWVVAVQVGGGVEAAMAEGETLAANSATARDRCAWVNRSPCARTPCRCPHPVLDCHC